MKPLHAREASAVHLDGARIWNAAAATGLAPSVLAAPADSVSACFSKGLGAPVGSVLAGSQAFIHKALRYRKMLGGGMRQVGVLCAAALYALDHHVARLADDHAHALRFARGLRDLPNITIDLASVQTNIVVFGVSPGGAADFSRRAAAHNVRINAISPDRLRAVTHLDVTARDIDAAHWHCAVVGALAARGTTHFATGAVQRLETSTAGALRLARQSRAADPACGVHRAGSRQHAFAGCCTGARDATSLSLLRRDRAARLR